MRLKEFFYSKCDSDKTNNENDYSCYSKKRSESTFIPPSGRDFTSNFYIDAITNEILLSDKRCKYRSNLFKDEQEALRNLRSDDSIIIKKADKFFYSNHELMRLYC